MSDGEQDSMVPPPVNKDIRLPQDYVDGLFKRLDDLLAEVKGVKEEVAKLRSNIKGEPV